LFPFPLPLFLCPSLLCLFSRSLGTQSLSLSLFLGGFLHFPLHEALDSRQDFGHSWLFPVPFVTTSPVGPQWNEHVIPGVLGNLMLFCFQS
jgi:hypothetical protein